MKHKTVALILSILLIGLQVASCSSGSTPSAAPSPSAVFTEAPQATPSPSPSPVPTPIPTAVPTPTPTPTPTPDPWADKFSPEGAYVCVKDASSGPWIYKDQTLSVTIRMLRGGPRNRRYYVADIYTRGNLFYGGFAYQSDGGRKTELPYRIARRYDAVFGITADYLPKKSNPRGVMMRGGKVYYDSPKTATLAVMPDGNLRIFEPKETTAKELLAMGVKDSFTFGPALVKDGQICKDVYKHPLRSSNYRAAVGQVEKGHYICITTLEGFTLEELSKLFIEYKCTLAYNLDGGHSACMIFMGEQVNRALTGLNDNIRQRALPDLVMLGVCPAVPDVKAPVYCNGVTIYPRNKPKPTDGPIGK